MGMKLWILAGKKGSFGGKVNGSDPGSGSGSDLGSGSLKNSITIYFSCEFGAVRIQLLTFVPKTYQNITAFL